MKAPIPTQVFVAAFLMGNTVQEIADRLGVSKQAVSQRASQLRARGLKLPYRNKYGRRPLDIEKLNRFIEKNT